MNGYIGLSIVSRCLVYPYLVVRLVEVSIFFNYRVDALFICIWFLGWLKWAFVQLSRRCLVYLYLVVRLVAVSICPVFKQMTLRTRAHTTNPELIISKVVSKPTFNIKALCFQDEKL